MKTVYLDTLGCPKNQVDSEVILGILDKNNYKISDDPKNAQIIIVNTCCFIEDAKRETIETVLHLLDYKKFGKCEKFIMTGCLPQRYKNEVNKLFPEVDSFIGVDYFEDILTAINENKNMVKSTAGTFMDYNSNKIISDKYFYSYVKIAEGCSFECSFCSIPFFKGKYRSRPVENIINEIKYLEKNSAIKEIILTAQDTAFYGFDKEKKYGLSELLKEVSKVAPDLRFRLLYLNPFSLSDEMIKTIKELPNVCKYFDIPFQHFNGKILKRMKRKGAYENYKNLVSRIRTAIPDAEIRTSLIVGFPGETLDDFDMLMRGIDEIKFNRLGIFKFSAEENTTALTFKEQVSKEEKSYRMEQLMNAQLDISTDLLKKKIGLTYDVLVEKKQKITKDKSSFIEYVGRSQYEAPEIDGDIYFTSGRTIKKGEMVKVKISHSNEYDLFGEEE